LFDIACSLADVINCFSVAPSPTTTTSTSTDHLLHLLHLISTLRNGETRFVPLLQTKIRDTLPHLATYIPIPVPSQPQRVPSQGPSGQMSSPVHGHAVSVGSPHPSLQSHTSASNSTISNIAFPFERTIKLEHDMYNYPPESSHSSNSGSPYGSPPRSNMSSYSGTNTTNTGGAAGGITPGISGSITHVVNAGLNEYVISPTLSGYDQVGLGMSGLPLTGSPAPTSTTSFPSQWASDSYGGVSGSER
jgi:hypothetical protein